jgi:predicted phage terminase large subunit-like protein
VSATLATPRLVADLFAIQLAEERPYLRLLLPQSQDAASVAEDDAADARDDLAVFCRRMFPDYRRAPHIDALIDALVWAVSTPDARLIVTLPPRHSKSLHVSEHLPAWFLGRYPDRRVIGAAHTQRLANRFSRRVRNKIGHPDWPFPGVRIAADSSAVAAWDLDGRLGGYYAVGIGGSPAGVGAHLLVIDDPIRNAAMAESALARESLWEWYREDVRPRLEPGGSIVVTATRWHHDDLTGRLLAAQESGGERWRHLHLPALDPDGAALWPERWPAAALVAIRDAIGTRAFESLYQGRPSVAAGNHFKRHWWRYWHRPGQPLPPVPALGPGGTPTMSPVAPLPPAFDESLQSWDMTFRQTTSGSFVVGQVWGRTGANRYLLDQYRARIDFPDTCLAVEAMAAKHPTITTKLVENKANGPAVVSALRHRVPGLVEVEPLGGKEARAIAATGIAEAGNVYLPHPHLAPWVDAFVEELSAFPAGATDDQVDAYSQAMARFEAGGGAFGYSYLGDGRGTGGQGDRTTDAFGNEVAAPVGRFLPRQNGHGGRAS